MFIPIDGARRSLDERVLLGKGAVAMQSVVAAGDIYTGLSQWCNEIGSPIGSSM
ncbi:hypothetical protein [Rhizobium sp. BR 362]|uniref:hypothetical protein n=1 Tax=Rhizobium sp. BR 362 TaxID=3040670 RepID=UPI002F3F222C